MICRRCQSEGTVSKVYDKGCSSTLMGFDAYYDEEGLYHSHDPNQRYCAYVCSNGHSFDVVRRASCGNCDFGGIETYIDKEPTPRVISLEERMEFSDRHTE